VRLGIDIGGTKTAVAAVCTDGSVAAMRTAPSGRGPAGVVDVAVRLARRVLVDVRASPEGVVAAGACMPGLVDPQTGRVRHAVNLGVDELDLAGAVGEKLGLPVAVENDVKAAALGAARVFGARAGETLGYLNLGTGLASAVVVDGRVVRGIGGVAGEIGHLPVGGDVTCTCGQVGCLETLASGSALARAWPAERRTVSNPFAAAADDEAAAAATESLCRGVGFAIQVLALASGAERVVIGGGLAALGNGLRDGVRADLERRAASSRMIEALTLPQRFELVPSSVPVAALGAAWLGRPPSDPAPDRLEEVD
jgi:predicted NBD/HSP70 family sugar kinase